MPVYDLPAIDNGADPRERVSEDPEQGAIAETGMGGCLDRVQKLLHLAVHERRRFAFSTRKSLGLDFPGRIHGQDTFLCQPREKHADRGHVLFDCGRRGLALQRFDVGGHRDRLNVFEILITGTLSPGQKLLDCPVVSGSCVSVADRDRKKFEELFAG